MRRRTTFIALGVVFTVAMTAALPLIAEDDERVLRRRARINRRVERAEARVDRIIDRYCERFVGYQERYGSDLPSFCDEESTPDPTPTPTPTATPTVTPSPTPTPSGAGVLISEVYYDVDDEHGAEGDNEWVELYNTNDSAVDLSGFMLGDASSDDTLPDGTTIPASGYLVITNDATTETFWSIGSQLIALGSDIGSGLGNNGDAVHLKDASGTVLDSMSYGSNTDAFDPSVADTIEGYSLERTNPGFDSNTAGDWQALITPTPGTGG